MSDLERRGKQKVYKDNEPRGSVRRRLKYDVVVVVVVIVKVPPGHSVCLSTAYGISSLVLSFPFSLSPETCFR
jgi:hypothetical protein